MKLRIRLENFKGVFARIWFNIAMTSDLPPFASVEIVKSYSFTLPPWKNLCHRWSRDQPQPGSLFPTTREAEERDPGNEVVESFALRTVGKTDDITGRKLPMDAILVSLDNNAVSTAKPWCQTSLGPNPSDH